MEYRHRGYTGEDAERDELDRQIRAAATRQLDGQIAQYRTPAKLKWQPYDYEISAREILAHRAGDPLPREVHPLTEQRLQARSHWSNIDLARDILAASFGDQVLGWNDRQVHASAITTHVLGDLFSATANSRVLTRQPRLLDKLFTFTHAVELPNYLAATVGTFELTEEVGPALTVLQEWQTVDPQATTEAVALRMAPLRLRFSEQMVVNDDANAMRAIVDATVTSASQNELARAFGLLTANGAMADGDNLFIDANTTAGQSKNAAAIDAGIAKLRAQLIHGQAADIEPFALLVPAADEGTARTVVHDMGGPEWLRVVGTSYLAAGAWYLTGDPTVWPVVSRATMAGSSGMSLRFTSGMPNEFEGSRDVILEALHTYEYRAISRTGICKIAIN